MFAWKCDYSGFLFFFFFFYFKLSLRKSLPVVVVIYINTKLYFYTSIKTKLTFNHQHIQEKNSSRIPLGKHLDEKPLSRLPLEPPKLPGARGSLFILKPNPPCLAHLSSRVQNSSGGIRSALPERIVQYFSASCGMSAVSEHIKQGYKFVMRALK